jgi:hypothetical protein
MWLLMCKVSAAVVAVWVVPRAGDAQAAYGSTTQEVLLGVQIVCDQLVEH